MLWTREGISTREIAERLRCDPSTVWRQQQQLLDTLTQEELFLKLVHKCLDSVARRHLREGRDRKATLEALRSLKNDPRPIIQRFQAGLDGAIATLQLAQATYGGIVH